MDGMDQGALLTVQGLAARCVRVCVCVCVSVCVCVCVRCVCVCLELGELQGSMCLIDISGHSC